MQDKDSLKQELKQFLGEQKASARLSNVLFELNVKNLSNLKNLDSSRLKNIPNIGKKTYFEFKQIQKVLEEKKSSSYLNESQTLNFVNILQTSINNNVEELGRRKTLLKKLTGEITLSKAGKIEGITRERVRQIERKCVNFILLYQQQINSKILDCLNNRNNLLTLQDLEKENPFFKGIVEFLPSNKGQAIFKRIVDGSYKVEVIKGMVVFSPSESGYYNDILQEAKSKYIIEDNKTIENIAIEHGRPDLIEIILDEWNDLELSAAKYLRSCTYQILKTSSKLFTTEQLTYEIQKKYEREFSKSQVGNTLIEIPNCYKFSKDGWGLEEKFAAFKPNEIQVVGQKLVNIIKSNRGRFWHCRELAQELWKNPPSFFYERNIEINHWQVNWVLEKVKPDFHNLFKTKRLVWEIFSTTKKSESDLNKLAHEILTKSGKPMNKRELKDEIEKRRGISEGFQIHFYKANSEIIEINPNQLGLRDRDVNISHEEEELLIKFIMSEFSEGVAYLHPYQIDEFRRKENICLDSNLFLISRLLRRHNTQKLENSETFWVKIEYGSSSFLIINPKIKQELPITFLMDRPKKSNKKLNDIPKGTPLSEVFKL